jgi:hypothetical protein
MASCIDATPASTGSADHGLDLFIGIKQNWFCQ